MHFIKLSTLLAISSFMNTAVAGPVAYGICQAGCAGLATACYAAAGATFGTITAGAGTPAVILGCNSAFGVCSAKCAAIALLPTP